MTARWPWARALVTGASSGIGESIARQLAEGGVAVVLVARSAAALKTLAAELRAAHGVDVEVLVADLLDPDALETTSKRLAAVERPVDLLVNNAGFGSAGAFAEASIDEQADMVRLNMLAVLKLAHRGAATFVPRGKGALLNVSSIGSLQPMPYMATYAATKAFVTSLSESLHEELRGTGVTVTALLPGLTQTKFVERDDFAGTRFPALFWLSASEVAGDALRSAARGDAIAVPGLPYKALMSFMDRLPRLAKRRMSGFIYRVAGPGH